MIEEGVAYVDSRDLAKAFGKEHKNVLASIDSAQCSPEFSQLNFQPVTKKQRRNNRLEDVTLYTMLTFDGFSFVAMGWTGAKAGQFKEAYIAKFNAMRRVGEVTPQTPAAPSWPPRSMTRTVRSPSTPAPCSWKPSGPVTR